jgi:hypothetical protein
VQQGLVVARDLVGRNHAALDAAWDTLGFRFRNDLLLSLELQFLWGVFCELVRKGPSFPTNGYDRVVLHLIYYLQREHGFPFEYAKRMVLSVQGLYNSADEVFDAVAGRGRTAYRDGGDHHFADIVLAFHKHGAGPDAYDRPPP